MDIKITSYEADLDQEYENLTEKHRVIKFNLENALSRYIKEGKGKPVTIQGPYGSGKTQLLYHLFKFTWNKGGVAIYTHLEKIIPPQEMGPTGYAEYLKELMNEEIAMLKKGKSKLMMGKVRDYAVSRIRQTNSECANVLFVDEIEQRYKLLDDTVKTDDHSPMRDVIGRVNNGEAGFYLFLAFAPVSFYEFSKGEAQTGRFLPIMLPIVESKTFRNRFREIGNLIWWMGRGRYRGISRIRDILTTNISSIGEISKKELQDVSLNMGSIGGVKAIEQFEMVEKIDDFDNFRDFLIHLEPKREGGEIFVGSIKAVKKCRIYDNQKGNFSNILEKSLRNSNISRITDIGYYLSIILDGLSASDGKVPLFPDAEDWEELLNIVEEIVLDFEGENRLPLEDLKILENNVSDFTYYVLHNADWGNLKEGYCIAPKFLHTLFPFPTSSPNLVPDKTIAEQRENLGDQTYLGREERNGISIFFFLNEDKVRDFLMQESGSFLKETKTLVAVNLGGRKEIDMPELAHWLKNQGRLRVIPAFGTLSDFLVSFFYWIRNERKESLPISSLSTKLEEYHLVPVKDKARKIRYYNSRIMEYLKSELPKISSPKYVLADKTGFDEYKTGRVGFASELIGFSFVDSKQDMIAMYRFRDAFENSKFIKEESSREGTGVPTALERGRPVIKDRKTRSIIKGTVLKKIYDSFSKYIPDLAEVVNETSREDFVTIPADDDSKRIFEGIYLYCREWNDPSKAEEKFREIKSKWNAIVNEMNELSKEIKNFQKLTYENISLTHCLEIDKNKIEEIKKILEEYQTKISPYTKFLLSAFVEKTTEVLELKLNEIKKKLREFQYSIEDQIKKYRSAFENIQNFEKDTFGWINKNKYEIQREFEQRFGTACKNFTKGEKIDLENIPDVDIFFNSLGEIVDELHILEEIDESLKQCKTKAHKINKELREWR